MRLLSWSGLLLSLGMLVACYPKGDPDAPIPQTLLPAAATAQRLVVVLPGRGDDLDKLSRSGIAQLVQSEWPDSDVVLTGLTLGYYMRGNAERRLHDEVLAPARARGYREVWVLGISMGGMGAVMADRAYPGDIDGLILLAPYLGDEDLLDRIEAAGGVASWQPGPPPQVVTRENFQVELWRHVQSWQADPAKVDRLWLGYGSDDRLGKGFALLAPVLHPDHVVVKPGGHAWPVWNAAARDILRDARAVQASP